MSRRIEVPRKKRSLSTPHIARYFKEPSILNEENIHVCLEAGLGSTHVAVHNRTAVFSPMARRTQLNSSLIESWGSKTEQTQAQSGSEPN